ncbi:transposase [Ensifer adhaerens]
MGSLPAARAKLRLDFSRLHGKVLDIARNDATCRRLMTVPGVEPIVGVAFKSAIDIPQRFKNSKTVGAVLPLTPRLYESRESKGIGG